MEDYSHDYVPEEGTFTDGVAFCILIVILLAAIFYGGMLVASAETAGDCASKGQTQLFDKNYCCTPRGDK